MSISISNLTKSFGDVAAVDRLSIEVPTGGMLALLGPSGCGKTTTMRCIAGLETADTGRIVIGDDPVFDADRKLSVPPNRRKVGMVFQSYAIWPHMPVFKNVSFPLDIQKTPAPETRRRVHSTLELVGLDGLASRPATKLSGGQMQRVALARSLVMEPDVLLLDEPLSNLDARLRDELRFELRRIQQQIEITAVYVTHDQAEALAMADIIAVMNEGRTVQVGSPVDIYESPRTRFVADFLGYENIFDASITEQLDGARARVRIADTDIVLTTRIDADARVGDTVVIGIRPDALAVDPDPAEQLENRLTATVEVVNFLGSQTGLRLRVTGAGAALRLVFLGKTKRSYAPGDVVKVSTAADDVRQLKDA